ncbi:MAG: bifunctional (p)ppGpp synthetase/guanosine-3',5'-bis(diphosphate) 3'-pyrophosphohydrolase [Deltaproteobacteria bacterium]|nr:bifunctional (p)ppGpp synthetase/guanosine-3',5'-bis(diphosphate) 3'-pyrophosphohydrolase [Deltaproteobacteria bacterium]
MARINEIVERVQQNFPEIDAGVLDKAYVYSAKVHQGQTRLSGEPYLTHPLEVAEILADMRLDPVTVAAGLLHDTVEDTYATEEELREEFGDQVADLVAGLTKLAKMEFQSREEHQAENFRKMLVAMSKDIRILLIKLADRLHNMRTLQYMSEDARARVSRETLDIYAPLAHRLGIYWMKEELEESAFRQLYPEVFNGLDERIQGSKKEREKYVETVGGRLSAELAGAQLQAEVSGRTKEILSLYKKMQSQNLSLEEIYDLIAFRVVVDGTKTTCYEALGIVHSLWRPVPGRVKDYIAMPKPNGYQSIHTTVIGPFGERIEIQIRTQEMHRVAELGIAAHWRYKEGGTPNDADEARFVWLRQLLEAQQQLADPNEFLEAVRVDLFTDEVYVFTPQGDVRALPAGATAVDFAYAVHTEVGNRCAGAKVNGKLVPLRSKLENGDTVEIVTSPHQKPRQEWLDYVVTGRARSRIRHVLKIEQVEHARKLGHQILERDLRRRGLNYDRLLKRGELTRAARGLSYKDLEAMLQALAYGKLNSKQVVRELGGDPEEPPPSLLQRVFRPRRGGAAVRVGGLDHVLVRFGQCCSPVPGDPVEGFITRGRGVTVHTRDCPRIFHLDPERRVPVTWDDEGGGFRQVKVRVVSENRTGLLAAISNTISAQGVNIDGGKITTSRDNRAVQTFELAIPDRKHLDAVIRAVSKVKGVLSVERVRT